MYPASASSYFDPSQASYGYSPSPWSGQSQIGGMLGQTGPNAGGYNWKGAMPGFAAGIGSMFGGFNNGSQGLQDYLRQAQGAMQGNYDQGMSFLDPYQQAGTGAMGQYQDFLKRFQDPNAAYNQIMGNYQMSPAAQFQLQQGTQAANRSAAAGGNVGTPAAQKALMQYSQGLSNQDMQQYFQNQMGINQMYSGGLQGLMGQGFNAASLMNQNRMGLGQNIAEIMQNLGMAGMYGQQSQNQGIMGGIGGLLGGIGSLMGFI